MQYFLEQEDKEAIAKNAIEREAKVFASNTAMWMELYGGGAPAEAIDDNNVYFPTDEEGLEQMAKEWEEAGWDSERDHSM